MVVIGALAIAPLVVGACSDEKDGAITPGATEAPTSAAPQEVQLADADDGKTVQLALNGTLIVVLTSNPSTGFSWSVTSPESEGLEMQGDPRFVPPGSTTPVTGAPGTEVFTFKATRKGFSRLTLTYARSFEPGAEGERTFSVSVGIQ
jgi:inhibitor of cysteine peptidase